MLIDLSPQEVGFIFNVVSSVVHLEDPLTDASESLSARLYEILCENPSLTDTSINMKQYGVFAGDFGEIKS